MKRVTRFQTISASLLLTVFGAQALVACSDTSDDNSATPSDGNGTRPNQGSTPTSPSNPNEPGNPGNPGPSEPGIPGVPGVPDGGTVPGADGGTSGTDAGTDASTDGQAPQPNQLVSITISPTSAKAAVGTIVPLRVKGTYGDGRTIDLKDYTKLTIAVDAELVAVPTRDFGGLAVRALAAGTTAVTVTDTATGLKATAQVQVTSAKLRGVEVKVSAPKIAKGLLARARATAVFDDGSKQDVTVLSTWSFSPEDSLAFIDATPQQRGVFRTLREGAATVKAVFGGQEATASFEIAAAEPKSVTFVDAPKEIALRTTATLKARLELTDGSFADLDNGSASFVSSNPAVLIVDDDGFLTAASVGSATITVSTQNNIKAQATITVVAALLDSLRVEAADETGTPTGFLGVSKTRQLALRGVYTDRSIKDLTKEAIWESKSPDVVSVDNDRAKGLITAKQVGVATIVVKYKDREPVEQLVVVVP